MKRWVLLAALAVIGLINIAAYATAGSVKGETAHPSKQYKSTYE